MHLLLTKYFVYLVYTSVAHNTIPFLLITPRAGASLDQRWLTGSSFTIYNEIAPNEEMGTCTCGHKGTFPYSSCQINFKCVYPA